MTTKVISKRKKTNFSTHFISLFTVFFFLKPRYSPLCKQNREYAKIYLVNGVYEEQIGRIPGMTTIPETSEMTSFKKDVISTKLS